MGLALGWLACGAEEESPADAASAADGSTADAGDAGDGEGSADAGLPDAICTPGTAWAEGTAMYEEATEDWGLTGVVGVRLNAVDFDNDGWIDVLVRAGGTRVENVADPAALTIRLLRNVEGTGFEDVTLDSGILDWRQLANLDQGRPMDVVAFADVDNDGDLDVYSGISTVDDAATGGETSEILLNNGRGVFSLTPSDNPIRREGEVDSVAGASFVDVDRDGFVDLWVGHHNYTEPNGSISFAQDRLFRGDGTGRFTEITDDAGLTTSDWLGGEIINAGLAHSRAWSAAACDLNNDGREELLVASYGRAPNHLWQADPTETGPRFINRSVDSGYAYDTDLGWQDNQFAMCFCAANRDAEGCADVAAPDISCTQPNWNHDSDREPWRLGGNSGATVCADLDGDGWFDLVTTEIRHWWAGSGADGSSILFNTGEADVRFERPAREDIGLEVPHVTRGGWDEGHMTATAFDADNDGRLDVYLGGSDYAGNRGLLYAQTSARQFALVPTDDAFEHNRSHGVLAADFDRDGDMDMLVGHSRARCDASAPNDCYPTGQVRLFENILGQDGNWLQVQLVGGAGSNRAAIGARIDLTSEAGTQARQVQGGYGHYGAQDDLVQHFGLGTACAATVTVRWPDSAGTIETFELSAGYRYTIVQGEGVTGWEAAQP